MSLPDGGMRQAVAGKPTLDEAVRFVLQSKTREYRMACLRHWKTLYGDEFANQVEAKVRAEWRSR